MKRIFKVLVLCVLVFALVSCGEKEENKTCTITFDGYGGELVGEATQVLNKGEIIVKPDNPTKEGYTFDGWTCNDTIWNFESDVVSKDMTLLAKWTVNQYTITIKKYDGNNDKVVSFDYGSRVNIQNPTKEDYDFVGYNEVLPSLMPARDIVLTPMWEEKQYTITFMVDNKTYQTIKGKAGEEVDLSKLNTPSKTGFVFSGWDKEIPNLMPKENVIIKGSFEIKKIKLTVCFNDGVTEDMVIEGEVGSTIKAISMPYRDGYSLDEESYNEIPSIMPDDDLTINIRWIPNQYSITIFYNDDITSPLNDKRDYGSPMDYPIPTREGYVFAGWTPTMPTTVPMYGGEYFATWSPVPYQLTLKNYYGDKDLVVNVIHGEVINVEKPTRTGYSVGNWSDIIETVMPMNNLTLEVQWNKLYYSITIIYNDGTTPNKVITQAYDTEIETIENPTRTGYTFNSWSVEIPSKMPAEDRTITANWTINQYTITLDYNDNVRDNTSFKKEYLQNLSDLQNPSRDHYTFDGWYCNDVKWNISENLIDEDITLKAKWIPIQYTLTVDNITYKETKKVDYDSEINITIPTRYGYTFVSWDVDVPERMPGNDLTITAIWQVNNHKLTIQYNDGITEDKDHYFDYNEMITDLYIPEAKPGYYFSGWDNYTYTYMPDSDLVYKAKWNTILTYTINSSTNEVAITGCHSSAVDEVLIWSEYEGYPVTSIDGLVFLNKENITKVIIPDSITSIGSHAFTGCKNLITVHLPNNITCIGENTFSNCVALENINIPNNVTRVMSNAFNNCPNLKTTVYDNACYLGNETNPYHVLLRVDSTATNITEYTINSECKVIYERVFSNCTSLDMVTIPNSVKSIGKNVFPLDNNYRITTKLNFNSLETLFNLDLTYPNNEGSNFNINKIYLNGSLVENLVMPANITSTQIRFYKCNTLKTFTFGSGITEIQTNLFYNCGTSLTTIYVPLSVEKINTHAFFDCNVFEYYYEGTWAQWCSIEKALNWYGVSYSDISIPVIYYTVHCSDGDVKTTYTITR